MKVGRHLNAGLILLLGLISGKASAQNDLPFFLEGTWKQENTNNFEHWNKLNQASMKGFSFNLDNDVMVVIEYLDITRKGKKVLYSATVMGQNEGNRIDFKLTNADSSYCFENPGHDFPRKVEYHKISENLLSISLSGDNRESITYKLVKVNALGMEPAKTNSSVKNKKVTGIGGIFFKSKDPKKLKEWYSEHLGLNTDQYGTSFEWRQGEDSTKMGFTQWSPFIETTNYFEPSKREFMINYRVENLEELVKQLKIDGVTVTDQIETYEYGKFVHIMDIEGNKIELWEPVDVEYDKIVEGRTK